MTEVPKYLDPVGDVIDEENSLSSSLSLSIRECSVLSKVTRESNPPETYLTPLSHHQYQTGNQDRSRWSTRKEPCSNMTSSKKHEVKSIKSPDITSSMREYLKKEQQCKTKDISKSEVETKNKDDTLCDILASVTFGKCSSDLTNATDEDIGSFFEDFSKLAEELSPNSTQECIKSRGSSHGLIDDEKTVDELLEEAAKLVRKNAKLSESNELEDEIFHRIEQEVNKNAEAIRKSPRNDKKTNSSPGIEMVDEHKSSSKKARRSDHRQKKFDGQKADFSSSSDLDDPIERHSNSEDLKAAKKAQEKKENLQKEITDVDKDFFEDLILRSNDKTEGIISGSPSLGQEDFSHLLKILQGQSDSHDLNSKNHQTKISLENYNYLLSDPHSSSYPEKEITEILKQELSKKKKEQTSQHEIIDSDSSNSNERSNKSEKKKFAREDSTLSRISSRDRLKMSEKGNHSKPEIVKVSKSQNDLYAVGLTPRLELFADAIPKLIAEKSENADKKSTETPGCESNEKEENFKLEEREVFGDFCPTLQEKQTIVKKSSNTFEPVQNSEKKCSKKSNNLGPSRSYDQLPKSSSSFKSSLDDVRNAKSAEAFKKPNFISKNPLKPKIPSKNISTFASKVKFSVKPTFQKQQGPIKLAPKKNSSESIVSNLLTNGRASKNFTKQDFEILYQEERHKNSLLKDQIDTEGKLYTQQIQSMRMSFEEELFALKKQTIIQKAKIDEISLNSNVCQEKRLEMAGTKSETKVILLEKELERQESMIQAYENENKKLMMETKKLQEELKNVDGKHTGREVKQNSENENEIHKLTDTIKDLKEEILKLNLEITELRTKNSEAAATNEDLIQQTYLLEEELKMFKDQLNTKDKFITDRLKSMSIHEMETRRKMEEIKTELTLKTEKLKTTKTEFDKFQQAVMPLEKELLELRSKEQSLLEKLQISKSHVEREKVLTIKLKDQVILDNKKILDLNRQVREMERILKRKNPDSVSALILTARSDNERINLEKIKLLEDRIAFLEGEIKAKEEIGQENLSEIQLKFGEMKEKYSNQVSDLEDKLKEALVKESKILKDICTQTIEKSTESKSVETKSDEKTTPTEKEEKKDIKVVKVNLKSQNLKEDTHLLATIRGLKLELANKDKNISKLMKEHQEIQKTNRRLQKEREKLLNDRRNYREEKPQRSKTTETNDQNSNVCPNLNGHYSNTIGQKFSGSSHKLYDPLQYSENGEHAIAKKVIHENEVLKEEIEKVKKEFIALKNRRLQDLNLLQEEHEREMANLVQEYSVKFRDSKVMKLQGQINTQVAIISHLKSQIEKLRDYKEQVVEFQVEREHLENKIKILNEKVKYLSTPGTEQLQLLQEKIATLQQRHESREMTLQSLVRDLLRNKRQCGDCKEEKGKNRQLCYFRKELDNILGMLQEIANVQ